MPNPFSITAATDTIPLDAQGRGSVTYTVSNVSGRARRGRASVVPAEAGQASWLSLEGDAERDFTADGTHQYTVRVATPAGTAPGRHTFGLDMVSVENPDEEWSQGPKVAFEIPATPPPKKPFPWWILAVILGLLLVGGLVLWLMLRDRPPEGVGLMGACAGDAECAAGLFCVNGSCVGETILQRCESDAQCVTGESCVQVSDQRLCLRQTGQPCRNPFDCVSRTCGADGTCQPGRQTCLANTDCLGPATCVQGNCLLPNGQACTGNLECQSGNCSQGKCASVQIPCGPNRPCPDNMVCKDNVCTGRYQIFIPIDRIEVQPGLFQR